MNSVQLRCFVEAASRLSFSRAAEVMHVSQPTVSHQVRSLEDELGCTLLARSTRTVRLTDDGFAFFSFSHEIIELEMRAKKQLSEGVNTKLNTLRIGLRDSFEAKLAVPALRQLNKEFKNFRPVVRQAPYTALCDMLETNVIDIMLSYRDPAGDVDFEGATQLHMLGSAPLCCVCSRDHHLAQYEGAGIGLDELRAEMPVVVAEPMHTISAIAHAQSRITHAYAYDQVIMGTDIEVTLSLVAAGLGFAIMLDIPTTRRDDLVYIACTGIDPVACGVRTRRGRQNKLVMRYAELIKERLPWHTFSS